MKTLLILLTTFAATTTFADIPSPPSLTAQQLKADNAIVIYALMQVTEEKISVTGDAPRVITTTRKIARNVKFGTSREGNRAIYCTKASQAGYSGFVQNNVECVVVTAISMQLPASDEDLLKIKITETDAVIK